MAESIKRADLIAQLVAEKAPVFTHFPFRVPHFYIAHHDPGLRWRSASSTMPSGSVEYRRDNEQLSKSWERAAAWADVPDDEFEAQVSTDYDGVWSRGFKEALRMIGALQEQCIPLEVEFVRSSQDWHCPACRRHKHDTVRFAKRGKVVARLVRHHDHVGDHVGHGSAVRFMPTLVCEDCNNADATAKARLNALGVQVPRWFSFTPSEIGAFVRPSSHSAHDVNLLSAQACFEASIVQEVIAQVRNGACSKYGTFLLSDEPELFIEFENFLGETGLAEDYGKDIAGTLEIDQRAAQAVLDDRSIGSLSHPTERCRVGPRA